MTQLGHRDILLSRLERDFGICSTALNRFRPYLSCRKQYFLINDQKSTETSLDLSVPQGLVRGLVPFSLYATRLTGLVENIVFVTMTIYSSVTLDCGTFAQTWSIHFHVHKTVLKISGYGWKKANSNRMLHPQTIHLSNTGIEFAGIVCILGFIFDSELSVN